MNLRVIFISVLVFFSLVATVFAWSAYSYYEAIHSDDPIVPSLSIDEGGAKIIRGDLTYELVKSESYGLEDSDIVETLRSSKATITWPDRSQTRLGESTRIEISRMYASRDYQSIEIAYGIERGKVWNTVIRSLLGDSYFEVSLPKESIVAGVRGTVFEVDLDRGYIHAVDHMTTLTDGAKRRVSLLPGELVDSSDILVKKGREILDKTWNEWNTLSDRAYETIRSLRVEERLQSLTRSGNFDRINTHILSKIRGFEDLEIARLVKSGDTEALKSYSFDSLISFSQRIPDLTRSDDREKLRSAILSKDLSAKLRDSIEISAIWDSLDTGRLSDTARDYIKSKGVDISGLSSRFQEGARSDTKKLLESLSGSLEGIFRF